MHTTRPVRWPACGSEHSHGDREALRCGDMILRFLSATGIYAVIDIGWNVSPLARGMYASLHAASGNDWSFGKTPDTWGGAELVAVVVFFLLIGYGNSRLAIEPAIAAGKLSTAVRNSLVLGLAAYATYIVPTYIAIANWPGALVPIDIAIGGALSLATSTIVTTISLRRSAAKAT